MRQGEDGGREERRECERDSLAGLSSFSAVFAAQFARDEDAQSVQAAEEGSSEDQLFHRRAEEYNYGHGRWYPHSRVLPDPICQTLHERSLHASLGRVIEPIENVEAQWPYHQEARGECPEAR